MMTTKDFAGQLAIWRGLAPALDQFTRWANRTTRAIGNPVHISEGSHASSLIAESAFEALANATVVDDGTVARASSALAGLPRGTTTHSQLSPIERNEAWLLAANIKAYLVTRSETPVFRPAFAGCGAVLGAEGDIRLGPELVEVKTVRRGFHTGDFRQALTYCALAHSVGDQFGRISLLNPRRGTYVSFTAVDLAHDIGAASWVELMQDLISGMSSFDVSP